MKRVVTRDDILRTTQQLIVANGIRAIRVDEIAQSLGISKRTLYEHFADKENLVYACLEQMSREQNVEVTEGRRLETDPLKGLLDLTDKYIDELYKADRSFLFDLQQKVTYAEHFKANQHFWENEMTRCILECQQKQLLRPDMEANILAKNLMKTLYEMRLDTTTNEECYNFNRIILRGVATSKALEQIDRK